MSIELRQYQEQMIAETRALIRGGAKSVLMRLPTGGGKTVLTASMAGTAAARGYNCWFVVHRRELVKQSSATFSAVGIPHGIVAAGFTGNRHFPVQVCSIQTLSRRMDAMPAPGIIFWDECHHMAAASWSAVRDKYPDAVHIGLSATPSRLDGRGLSSWFSHMVHGPSTRWLIDEGFLAPYRIFAPPAVDLSAVHTVAGDFNKRELELELNKSTVTGDAISHYSRLAPGKRAVVFEASVARSMVTVAAFNAAGIPAAHIDGETDALVRDATLQAWMRGDILVVSNVDLFGEGFDLPALEVAILMRPTKSLTIYLQQVGRALRMSPGKTEALILDHSGNCHRHGLPDEDREWSLEGRRRKSKSSDDDITTKLCPQCFHVSLSTARSCKSCGLVFVAVPTGRGVETVDGDLVELDVDRLKRESRQQQAAASTLDDLIALGKSRGYKNPYGWANHIFKSRQNRWERA